MTNIRSVWDAALPSLEALPDKVADLLRVEVRVMDASRACLDIVQAVADEGYVEDLSSLMRSAHMDLVGGCEIARAGYMKQAYSLWRSWFEQSIFYLYFLEAPLHKEAWKVKEEVDQNDDPQYRLMLHQLLASSSEKHPFALVYDGRFSKVLSALKISSVPKGKRPIARASRVLTTLSQGVHGTYQPNHAKDMDMLCSQIEKHCLPVLVEAEGVINTLWMLFITSAIALPEEVLVKLRDGVVTPEFLSRSGVDEADKFARLAPYFSQAFSY